MRCPDKPAFRLTDRAQELPKALGGLFPGPA